LWRRILFPGPPARRSTSSQQEAAGLFVPPQNLIEFWAVATRPVEANGLGLSVEKVAEEVTRFEAVFRLADEPSELFRQWRQLVEKHKVKGKQVHDARLVAIMIEGGVARILVQYAGPSKQWSWESQLRWSASS
jgi:predicted nucleic acid-binding protein